MTHDKKFNGTLEEALTSLVSSYQTLLQNETIHRELTRSSLTGAQWRTLDTLTNATAQRSSSYDLFSLYEGISTLLEFLKVLAGEVRPSIRTRVTQGRQQGFSPAKQLLEMTASNLDSNITLLLDRLSDLYGAVTHEDQSQNGTDRLVGKRFRELANPESWQVEG